MHLNQLSLLNFKNYAEVEFSFSPEVNCLFGDNGSGKTNVLDAVYYLSHTKSYYNTIDSQNILHGEQFFVIQGEFSKGDEIDKVHCGVKKGHKKVLSRNSKEYSRLADHFGLYPVVIITPTDSDLIKEGSEFRRKFIDSIISQYNRRYLDDLISYNKALAQRNKLLKYFYLERTFDADSLEIWDLKLVELGIRIFKERESFIKKFEPLFMDLYKDICGGVEVAGLSYHSQLKDQDMMTLLQQNLDKDRVLQRTTVGIHKDDLLFKINDFPLKKFGSQGQQKSYLITLRLAQFQFIKDAAGEVPILLLDDVFDKIDDKRVAFLMQLVSQHRFGQIFITDTHEDRVSSLFNEIDIDVKTFRINKGSLE